MLRRLIEAKPCHSLTLAHLLFAILICATFFYGAQYLGQTYIFNEVWHDPTISQGATFEVAP
jgi:hypothetical protein